MHDLRQFEHLPVSIEEKEVVLATASSGGTISAVRHLAQLGLKVNVISSEPLSAAAWSRFATRRYKAPREKKNVPFLQRLLEIGKQAPGKVLLPTSDETVWLYANHAAELQQYFDLHVPSVDTMRRILDKNLLAEAAQTAGLAVLPTWEPHTLDELIDLAPEILYPVLIKPRTQVQRTRNDKGAVAYSSGELIEKFRSFLTLESISGTSQDLAESGIPLLQHFIDTQKEGVCSITGYIDETEDLFLTRRARKILQRSLPAGVGVCFESLDADPELSNGVRRLCQNLGYFGIFEVEFLNFQGQWAVIDFNPRLFNQSGMDILRGMPLAQIAYLDAARRIPELRLVIEQAREKETHPAVFHDRFTLWAILTAKTLMRRSTREERKRWSTWREQHRSHAVDAAANTRDFVPQLIHILSEITLGLKSLRRFFRATSPALPQVRQPKREVKA